MIFYIHTPSQVSIAWIEPHSSPPSLSCSGVAILEHRYGDSQGEFTMI